MQRIETEKIKKAGAKKRKKKKKQRVFRIQWGGDKPGVSRTRIIAGNIRVKAGLIESIRSVMGRGLFEVTYIYVATKKDFAVLVRL